MSEATRHYQKVRLPRPPSPVKLPACSFLMRLMTFTKLALVSYSPR